jgi:hypothetical protein
LGVVDKRPQPHARISGLSLTVEAKDLAKVGSLCIDPPTIAKKKIMILTLLHEALALTAERVVNVADVQGCLTSCGPVQLGITTMLVVRDRLRIAAISLSFEHFGTSASRVM